MPNKEDIFPGVKEENEYLMTSFGQDCTQREIVLHFTAEKVLVLILFVSYGACEQFISRSIFFLLFKRFLHVTVRTQQVKT